MLRDVVATDTGVAPRDGETPREYLDRVAADLSLDQADPEGLARAFEREVSGGGYTPPSRVRQLMADHGFDAPAEPLVDEDSGDAVEPGQPSGGVASKDGSGTASDENESEDNDSGLLDADTIASLGGDPDARNSGDADGVSTAGTEGTVDVASGGSSGTGRDADERESTDVVDPAVDDARGAAVDHGVDGDASAGERLPASEDDGPARRADALASRLRGSASRWTLRYLPVLALVPLLGAPVPTHVQATREAATYFQALAFARDGLGAYSYLTLRELPLSLHLHSLLASPLVAHGFVTGGRLVSALAALAATVLAAIVARHLFGWAASVLAPALLWVDPYFFRFAWAATPEMLALCLTTATVAAAVRFDATDRVGWLGATLTCLALAIVTHPWAFTAALPVAVFLLVTRGLWESVAVAVTEVGALAVVGEVATLQPEIPHQGFAVTATGPAVYVSAEWLEYWTSRFGSSSTAAAEGVLFVGAFVVVGYWLWHGVVQTRTGEDGDDGSLAPGAETTSPGACAVLLGTWALAGLVLPLALPGGVIDANHYYLWGAVVPVTLTVAWFGARGYDWLHERDRYRRSADMAEHVLGMTVAILVVLALLNGAVVGAAVLAGGPTDLIGGQADAGLSDTAPGEARAAGLAIRERGVTDAADVVFVGNWARGDGAYTGGVARVLVYSGTLPTGEWRIADSDAVRYAPSVTDATDCEVAVVREGDGSVAVEPC